MKPQDDIQDILRYYSQNEEDHRYERHQLEFALMKRIFKAYLSEKPQRVLELGAGSGHYTQILAEMGHEVTALEPTQKLLELNEKRIRSLNLEERVHWVHADARELLKQAKPQHENLHYDVILNMGPFYHLVEKKDREQLLQDSLSILKPEGLHMGVFLSKVGYASYVLAHQPESLLQDPEGFRDIMVQGYFSQHPRNGTFRGHFTDLAEISEMHQKADAPIRKLHVLDPCIGGDDQVFNRLSDEQKELWAEVLFALSTDPGFWASGRTWLAITTRP